MNVLYLVKQFPSLSQTFVLNEVAELTRRGCGVYVMAAFDPRDGAAALDPRIASRVSYLEHDYAYPYAPSRKYSEEDVRERAAAALEADDELVRAKERRTLWDLVSRLEPDPDRARRGLLEGLAVLRFLRQRDIRHVHCDFAEDNVRLAWLVNRSAGVPFTFKMRAYDIFAEPPADLGLWASAAERVLTISEYNRAYICASLGLAADKVEVVRDGIRVDAIRPVDPYVHRPFKVLSASRLVEKKGFPDLIAACAILARRGIDLRCEIYGDGPMGDELARQVEAQALGSVVTLGGRRAHEELLRLMDGASVFVLPCLQARNGDRDGTPNVLMEAMARALPVVSTWMSGIPEIVEHGSDGLLVAPGDPQSLAAAIERIHADRELAERLRGRARARAERLFRIERTAEEFLALAASWAPAASR